MSNYDIDEQYMKNLRMIIEGEVEEAEVIMAARGFSKEFQDMIQKVGRLANEQLGPVVDQIRLTYGPEMAESFSVTVKEEMDAVLMSISSAKDTLDNVVTDITNGTVPGNDMDGDEFGMDDGMGVDDEFGDPVGDEFADPAADELGGELGDEVGGEFDDEFGAEEPLGRSALESKEYDLKKGIVEMRSRLSKARKLQEKKLLGK